MPAVPAPLAEPQFTKREIYIIMENNNVVGGAFEKMCGFAD
jgi:hypothetical protein